MRANRSESGQIAILLVVTFFGSIAMAAVAIDGGNAFMQRRIAQNAADNAALAAAAYLARNKSATEVGLLTELIQIAEANGIDDWDGVLSNEVNDNVEAYYTDINGDRISGCNIVGSCSIIPDATFGFEVIAHKQVDTFLASLIGWNTIAVEARGVAVMYPTYAGMVEMANLAIGECPEEKAYDGSGSSSEIIGGIHTNDDLYLSGSDNHFHGFATHLEGYTPAGTNSFSPGWPANGSILPNPLDGLQTSMFAPGQSLVQGMIVHDLSSGGKVDIARLILQGYYNPSTGMLDEGIYFAGNNEIEISDSNITGTVTFVSENHVKISGSNNSFTAYIDSLLIFSNKQPAEPCKDWVVDVGGSGNADPIVSHAGDGFSNPVVVQETTNIYRGLIYAPRGKVMTSGSKSTIRGAILAQAIKLNGTQELIIYDSGPGTPRIELIK